MDGQDDRWLHQKTTFKSELEHEATGISSTSEQESAIRHIAHRLSDHRFEHL